jgi:NADH dehydrogenase
MRVAVSGASGFVARHLIPLLLSDGHEVRGLARHAVEDTGAGGTAAGFTFFPGDVRRREDAATLCDGCAALIHLAASFDPKDNIADINGRGTRTLVEAVRAAGVGKIVHLGCLGAEAASRSAFYRSKWRAEQLVRASEVPYTILLPSLVVGNGDGVVRPLAHLIRALPAIPLPGNRDARLQPIDVGDLCRCIVAALEGDRFNEAMLSIGGPMYLTLSELAELVAAEVGRNIPRVLVPHMLATAARRCLPASARALFAEARRAQFAHGVVASPGTVRRTFGFEPANIALRISRYLA